LLTCSRPCRSDPHPTRSLLFHQIALIPRHRKDSPATGAGKLCGAPRERGTGATPGADGVRRAELGRQLRGIARPWHDGPPGGPADDQVEQVPRYRDRALLHVEKNIGGRESRDAVPRASAKAAVHLHA